MSGSISPLGPATIPAEPSPVVGLVGLGRMGLPLARRLVQSGLPVIVWNRTQPKVEPLVAEGARWAVSPKELARSVGKGITFLVLTDGPAVKRILFGVKGLARGAPAGALFVNLSTIDPEESRSFGARLHEKGIHYLDAPMAGSVDQVLGGELSFFVGGDEAQLARARPLLEKMGRRVYHMGPTGAGNSMKLVNNTLTVGITALTAEALALADGLQLDRAHVIEALLAGGGRSSMLERKSPNFQSRQYPAQFTTALARKDLKLVEKAGTREGRSLTMTREARKSLDAAIAGGHSEDDFSSVFEVDLAGRRTVVPVRALAEPAAPPGDATSPGGPPL